MRKLNYDVDAIVIGAGVVGLACARALAEAGMETLVLEKEGSFGQGISSRNSEVIHAGLYYSPGSLKAKLCRSGRDLLYRYCDDKSIPYKKLGKWVVANGEQQCKELAKIHDAAKSNHCEDVYIISGKEAINIEQELKAELVLVSPSTGIIDSHSLMMSLLADIEHRGGKLVPHTKVDGIDPGSGAIIVEIDDEAGTTVSTRFLINAAGLSAVDVAKKIKQYPADLLPETCFAKGNYYSLLGKAPFSRLIYPVPEPGGLGVHLTLDLAGRGRFGPDVEWVKQLDYSVTHSKAKIEQFCQAIKQYWPGCNEQRLEPDYAGIRPKIGAPENFLKDFVIQCPKGHGIPGLINLFGIESPGLTACLAIANESVRRLGIIKH